MATTIATLFRSRFCLFPSSAALSLTVVLLAGLWQPVKGATWRVGDSNHPWCLHPVSALLDAGDAFKQDYIWGGAYSVEVVVDEDGDGLIDEDPVDIVDDDGDGLYNEDPVDEFDNDEDGVADEDPVDGVDNDEDGLVDEDDIDYIDNHRDGLVNEDGPDAQFDNDGDGFLNEDGMRTGGVIRDSRLRTGYEGAPFFRFPDAESAAADPQGAGYGWGNDDRDSRFNEDDVNGRDDDGDGLVDEDPPGPPISLPRTWMQPTFTYDMAELTLTERQGLAFAWDRENGMYEAKGPGGEAITAQLSQVRFRPLDWLRPIRLDSTRNMVILTKDRFLSGIFSGIDPMAASRWGALASHAAGATHVGTSGFGQVADGNIFTARSTAQASYQRGFRVHFLSLFYLDMIRLRPRPDFPDRTPSSFDIFFAGDKEFHFRTTESTGSGVYTRMIANDPVIPRQIDQRRPVVKEYHFEKGGEFGPPPKVRILDFLSNLPEGQTWELAEFEAYGSGYALDASYVTEIIDVGTDRPRFRRYFDSNDPLIPDRPILFESIKTVDSNKDGQIRSEERADVKAAVQFDPERGGRPIIWGRVRWHGQIEGSDGGVQVRVRSGTSLDTRVYNRKVGRGVVSPFIGQSIVADWPATGDRIDVHSYVHLSAVERSRVKELPANNLGSQDGQVGGWTPWSAPFSFAEGLVERDGSGGLLLPLPPLHRYIQFRFDFDSKGTGGVNLDYIEFDFSPPVVTRGVLSEIYPDTVSQLGIASSFQYVLKPDMTAADAGFNRIDIIVPSRNAQVESLTIDDLPWERVPPPTEALLHSRTWLDTLTGLGNGHFASVTYFDSTDGTVKLGIKTALLKAVDFPRGEDREMVVVLSSPIFRLLTRFRSWIWNDRVDLDMQPTQPGNASDRLPTDQVEVMVQATDETLNLRQAGPNPFTPNGDGINDVLTFEFDLFLLTDQADVTATLYALDGHLVRQLELAGNIGEQLLEWDGRDENGELVPPGIYLYRLFVNSDTRETKEILGTVAVAY